MSVKVEELMSSSVVTTQPHKSIEHAAQIMQKNGIGVIPVVDPDGHAVGIVSATDLVGAEPTHAPVSTIMTEKVYTVPAYNDVSIAARVMRNHRIHHVIVTDEQKVVGILSSFDLLALVEEHRYVQKNAPTQSKRRGAKRA